MTLLISGPLGDNLSASEKIKNLSKLYKLAPYMTLDTLSLVPCTSESLLRYL